MNMTIKDVKHAELEKKIVSAVLTTEMLKMIY